MNKNRKNFELQGLQENPFHSTKIFATKIYRAPVPIDNTKTKSVVKKKRSVATLFYGKTLPNSQQNEEKDIRTKRLEVQYDMEVHKPTPRCNSKELRRFFKQLATENIFTEDFQIRPQVLERLLQFDFSPQWKPFEQFIATKRKELESRKIAAKVAMEDTRPHSIGMGCNPALKRKSRVQMSPLTISKKIREKNSPAKTTSGEKTNIISGGRRCTIV